MKPEQLATSSFISIGNQIDRLIKKKPDEVFTIDEAATLVAAAKSSLRLYAQALPKSQKTIIKHGSVHRIVFGSAKAIAKFNKLIQ